MLSVYVNIWSILVLALTTDSYMVTYNDQARVAANHVCGMEWCCWWVLLIVGGLMVGLGGAASTACRVAQCTVMCCHEPHLLPRQLAVSAAPPDRPSLALAVLAITNAHRLRLCCRASTC